MSVSRSVSFMCINQESPFIPNSVTKVDVSYHIDMLMFALLALFSEILFQYF